MNRYFEDQAGKGYDDLPSLNQYYASQAGGTIDSFQGYRVYGEQKGNGFFGRFLKSSVLPLLKKIGPYLGKKALSTVTGLASEMSSGQSLGQAVKRTMKRVGSSVAQDISDRLDPDQQGSGRKRRKVSNKKKVTFKKLNPGLIAIAKMRKKKGIKGKAIKKKVTKKGRAKKRKSKLIQSPIDSLF